MRINTNIPALNTHRMMGITNRSAAKNLEKLSSGKRLNRSSDDAAGLAISEKMEAQIRGLRMASKNSLDGMSLIQTAEGALNEVHAMLQRMRELAVYSANGTMILEDREAIQREINQLTSQINTVGYGTEFNKLSLLQGNQGPKTNTIEGKMSTATPARVTSTVSMPANVGPGDLKITINGKESLITLQAAMPKEHALEEIKLAVGFDSNLYLDKNAKVILETKTSGGAQEIKVEGSLAATIFGTSLNGQGTTESLTAYAQGYLVFEKTPEAGSSIQIGDERIDFFDSSKGSYKGTNIPVDIFDTTNPDKKKTPEQIVAAIAGTKIDGVYFSNGDGTTITPAPIPPAPFPQTLVSEDNKNKLRVIAERPGLEGHMITLEGSPKACRVNLQVGANERQNFKMDISDCRSKALRISSSRSTGNPGVKGAAYTQTAVVTGKDGGSYIEYAIDVTSEEKASAAITVFDNAISKISEERSKMGAIQNRLEKTIANLDNTAENLTAAKSRIADTDMALEMSEFSKLNIMQQAGTAMLAQANQQPQLMLKLLNA